MTGRRASDDLVAAADREGPKDPITTTPPRPLGSVRRTTTLDGAHPEGMDGPTHYVLRARDLRTRADGSAEVLAEAEVRARVDPGHEVLALEATPPEPRLALLAGRNTRAGWRGVVDELLPDQRDERSLLYLLLDALSAWSGLARFGLIASNTGRTTMRSADDQDPRSALGICAGWRVGGSIDVRLQGDRSITQFVRPPMPSLEPIDDPLAWHAADPVERNTMRRRRRIDVIDGDPLRVDAMFCDSFGDSSGQETILHEYAALATVDPETLVVRSAQATPHVLPWYECPWAAGSVQALVGEDVRTMRRFVGAHMRGTNTCTHLNELIRTFADIGALAQTVRS
ncbi:MAG: hypothetical protein JWN46_3291 [Acidimicrobiales bacterium]|nr:hypothetical protein [Acidimicrobiales bacterium]